MQRVVHVLAVVVAVLCVGASGVGAARPLNTPAADAPGAPGTQPEGYIVMLEEDTADTDSIATELGRAHGLGVGRTWNGVKGFHFRFPSQASEQAQARVLDRLRSDRRVRTVAPDGIVEAFQTTFTFARVSNGIRFMWNYTGTPNVNYQGSAVRLAIIDSGVDLTHPDLRIAPNLWYNAITSGTITKTRQDVQDLLGHGTHCAGIAAAIFNGFGVLGVAPNIEIVPVRVLDAAGSGTTATVIDGLNWLYNNSQANNIKVASMSIGGGANQALDEAVNQLNNIGVAVVVAAGNYGADLMNYSPARAAGAITITAIGDNQEYNNPTWSNWNSGKANVYAAPGVSILSTWKSNATCNPCYNTVSGTSMAAPHVAGLLAAGFANSRVMNSATAKSFLASCASEKFNRIHRTSGQPLGPAIRYRMC